MAWRGFECPGDIFILNFSLPPRSEQVSEAHANKIKHDHSPEVVLDPRYDSSYKALYIYSHSISLTERNCSVLDKHY